MPPSDPRSDLEFVSHVLPPVVYSMAGRRPTGSDPAGDLEFVSHVLPPVVYSMKVPHLILTLRLADAAATADPEPLASDLLTLVDALSGYEKSLGGRGLRLQDKGYADGAIILTLAPVAAEKAAERLDAVKRLLADITDRTRPPTVIEALAGLERSSEVRCRAALARRPWTVEGRVAMPG